MTERPAYATASGWNAIARNRIAVQAASRVPRHADYVVVGAGFAGLAVAHALARRHADRRVVLLDAGQPGANSSGRNSGFMIDLPYARISAGDAARHAWQTRLLGFGREALARIVTTQAIDCDWRETGHYKVATTAGGRDKLDALAMTLDARRVEYRALDADAIRRELGTLHYRAALWLRNCTLVQPAELVHGLIASLPANVEIRFGTPVKKLARAATWTLDTPHGEISSPCVALCVNTALPRFGYARYRQLAVYTYAGLTRRLTDAEFASLGEPDDWGATPVERLEATSRKVNGNRLLFRQGFSYETELDPANVRPMLTAGLRARYPFLGDNAFEYVWGGAVSMTRNDAPVLDRPAAGLYTLSGCNASGILKMTALGELLADIVSGADSPLLAETLRFADPGFIPPEPIRRIAVHLNLKRFARELTSGAPS
ncbi:FAD-binding oxidoreductase [Paraburkholderia sp. J63]|uniref:NAD(P)/FAD-dependent oxidoreductase n=1 Tax=Paraburkholderia sp. J63 TaxID=2805434 RepID=UPI002ABDDD2F|nr:FAD-binding oxidoreductase [Paraburkholderia sp. J63]